MLGLMSGLLGAPNERIWPGMRDLPLADKFSLPPQPYNYLRKVRGAGAAVHRDGAGVVVGWGGGGGAAYASLPARQQHRSWTAHGEDWRALHTARPHGRADGSGCVSASPPPRLRMFEKTKQMVALLFLLCAV